MKNDIDEFEIDQNKIILKYYFKLIHLIFHLVDLIIKLIFKKMYLKIKIIE